MGDRVLVSSVTFCVASWLGGCGSVTDDPAGADAAAGTDAAGSPDAAAACAPVEPIAISTGPATAAPRIAAHAGGYGVVWGDPRDSPGTDGEDELYFARLDAAGERMGADVRVTMAPGNLAGLAIAWDGTGYGVAFNETRDEPQLLATRLGPEADELFDEVPLGPLGTPPGVAVSGDTLGVTWADGEVLFARQSGDTGFGSPVPVGGGNNPSIAPAGAGGWGVAYHSDVVYFALLDASGNPSGNGSPVSDGPGVRADIDAGPDGFGVAWSTAVAGGEVMFAALDAGGVRIGDELPLTSGTPEEEGLPVIAASPVGYGIAWTTDAGDLDAVVVDSSGTVVTRTTLSSTAFHPAFRPLDIAFNGESFAVVWLDTRDGEPRPYFGTYCP